MSKLLERRSIRKYDPNIKISREEMNQILTEATRAPSSMNMQPWRFVVVETMEGKAQLKPALYGNLLQLETSSAMIVILTDLKKFEYAEQIFDQAVEANLMPVETRNKQIMNITNMIPTLSDDSLEKAGLIDGGLVAMQLMHIAKEHGYDTCPIGGFRHEMIVSALNLDINRYKPVMIVSIGKRAEDGHVSLRLPIKDITWYK